MRRLAEYRCTACGVVEEILLDEANLEDRRYGFCDCRPAGLPVRKVRVFDIARSDALDQ